MKRLSTIFLGLLFFINPLIACNYTKSYIMGGSTSVYPVFSGMEKEFNDINKIRLSYAAGGSSKGESGVKDGTLLIGFVSRDLKAEMKQEPYAALKFAIDGIIIIANPPSICNSSDLNISGNNLKEIYENNEMNWSQIIKDCASTDKVNPINRESGSGTKDGFYQGIKADQKKGSQMPVANSSGSMLQRINETKNSIGYTSFAERSNIIDDSVNIESNIKILKYNDIEATESNLKNGEYKLSRDFQLTFNTTNKSNLNIIKIFLRYLKDDGLSGGQKHIVTKGLVSQWEWLSDEIEL